MAKAARIDIIMTGDARQVHHMLERLQRDLEPMSLAIWMKTTVTPWFRERSRGRFHGEGDDVTGSWAPLREATWDWRIREGVPPQHPINRRTGALESYITGSAEDARATTLGATLVIPGTPPSGEMKKKVERAQFGDPSVNTVARPVLGMNERDLLAVLTDLSLYVSVGQYR